MSSSSTRDKEAQLYREISQSVPAAVPGVEVLAVELGGDERFTVFIDDPRGVDHALCERVSTALRPYVERYSVEVSSPGLDRPLRTGDHFRSAVGRRVRGKTATRRFKGTVLAANESFFRLDVGSSEPTDIPYGDIVRANLIDEGVPE